MKKLIIFLMTITSAYSQNFEPVQVQININGIPTYISSDSSYFKTNKMVLGWHWEPYRKISEALFTNMADIQTSYLYSINESHYADSTLLFVRCRYQSGELALASHCYNDNSIVFTKSLQYEPTLNIEPNNKYKLNIREGDPSNPVFGFLYKRGRVINNPTDENYSRLILDSSTLVNEVVLAEPWPSNHLNYVEASPLLDSNWTGRRYYLSMNLRRYGNETLADTTALLKIEVPCIYIRSVINWFTFEYDSVMAKFDSIPATSYSYTNPNNRGKALDLKDTSEVSVFYIRAYMLPLDNEDITISALIDFGIEGNKLLKSGFGITANSFDKIDSLKIKVTYLSNEVPLAIDWLRFETPNTRKLLWGHNDENIIEGVQEAFDSLSKPSYANRGIKPFRITVNIEGSLINWASERYIRKLIGDIITGSNGPILPEHYNHYINAADRWLNLYSFKGSVATPISESNRVAATAVPLRGLSNQNFWKTLGNYQGYKIHPVTGELDVFNSGYETFLRSGSSVSDMRGANFNTYMHYDNIQFVALPISKLAYWESFLYKVLLNPLYSGTLYEDKPWYSQCFTGSDWTKDIIYHQSNPSLDKICSMVDHGMRVITTEELRLMNWISIIQGAKGLFYDTSQDYIVSDILHFARMSIPNTALSSNALSKDGVEFLELDEIGSDFLGGDVDYLGIYSRIPTLERNEIAEIMGTRTDRFYIGKKSTRLELRKLHEWVLNNEEHIMSQRLQAWYGCGYKIWETRHPRWGSTDIMRKFINVDSVKTRKLYAVDSTGYSPSTGYEPNTENFLDITLLADKNDTNMTKGFTIGIQNRRTDPLIYFTEVPDDKHMLFLSSNEFDVLCDNGGVNPMRPSGANYPDTLWQKYYWKRLGCREITLPFNYCDTTNNGSEYALLRVTELKADNDYDENWPWWRKERYNNYIDTVIGQNSSLALKFLPGEGKMLKVEILRPNPISGNLKYSNQSKMVVYPVYENGEPTDAVRYHLAYHKRDADRDGLMTVYYRRSLPLTIDSLNRQIKWEPEIKVSDSITIVLDNIPALFEEVAGYYPSIVVRNDGNIPKAYVVFNVELSSESICDDPICDPAENHCKQYLNPICETILDVSGTLAEVISKGKAIHRINSGHPDNWGTPVVNASANGNYYAWSDSLCGIGVGFKYPCQEYFESYRHLKFGSLGNKASHPSVNVYSAVDLGEEDCSLVWQETNYFGREIIYYTKLHYDSLDIDNYIAKSLTGGTRDSSDGILRLSNNFESGRYPTIYRAMTGMHNTNRSLQREAIAWESKKSSDYADISFLNIINFPDTVASQFTHTHLVNVKNIYGRINSWSSQNKLNSPVLSQTISYQKGRELSPYKLRNSCIINFVDTWSNFNSQTNGQRIYHLWLPQMSILNDSLSLKDYKKTIYPVSEGTYPHLALSPYANFRENVWKNHRIFEYGSLDGNPKIIPNPAYFYPFNDCVDCIKAKINIGFGSDSPISYQKISDILLKKLPTSQNQPIAMNLPYIQIHENDSTENYFLFDNRDTLYTDWWQVDSTAELNYMVTFNDTNVVSLKLQKLSDSTFIELPAPFLPGSGFAFMVFYLINGNNDSYRLAMINNQPTMCKYTEDLYFAEQFIVDTIYAKGRISELKNNVIDLNPEHVSNKSLKIICSPNPASDELLISTIFAKNLNSSDVYISIYNQTGIKIYDYKTKINTTTILPLHSLSNGVYFIRAYIINDNLMSSETEKFVIIK